MKQFFAQRSLYISTILVYAVLVTAAAYDPKMLLNLLIQIMLAVLSLVLLLCGIRDWQLRHGARRVVVCIIWMAAVALDLHRLLA